MLEAARTRFEGKTGIKYIVANYSEYMFNEEYDIILSALSIHHLSDDEKEKLYKKCFTILRPGGVFINAEQVLGETNYLDWFYKKEWQKSIEKSGLPQEEITGARERMKLDKEATVQVQLKRLHSPSIKLNVWFPPDALF